MESPSQGVDATMAIKPRAATAQLPNRSLTCVWRRFGPRTDSPWAIASLCSLMVNAGYPLIGEASTAAATCSGHPKPQVTEGLPPPGRVLHLLVRRVLYLRLGFV